jgi:type II secretory pathway pseudopilin PulG
VRYRPTSYRGFSLIEACFAIAIVGGTFVAMMAAMNQVTLRNADARRAAVAGQLANNLVDASIRLPMEGPTSGILAEDDPDPRQTYLDVEWMSAQTEGFSPPLDAQLNRIPELSTYRQLVTVRRIRSTGVNYVPGEDGTSTHSDWNPLTDANQPFLYRVVIDVFHEPDSPGTGTTPLTSVTYVIVPPNAARSAGS